MELHEEIRRARKELDLSQAQLAALCGIQRRQLSTLERGGNVTLNTVRKVLAFLPNLREFTFEQIRMKPEYRDLPPFEWQLFYSHMLSLQSSLDELGGAINAWLTKRPTPQDDPGEGIDAHEGLARELLDIMQRQTGQRKRGA